MSEGTQAWSTRGPIRWGILMLILLLCGFGGWSIRANIAGAVIAPGLVEVGQNRQAIEHPDGGVVARINVREGDSVEAGAVLVELDSADLASELTITRRQLVEVRARRARLEAERDGMDELLFSRDLIATAQSDREMNDMLSGQGNLFAARRDTLTRETDQLARRALQIADQIRGLEAQRDALVAQRALVGEDLANQQALLERGLAQSARVIQIQREDVGLAGSIAEIEASISGSQGRITEIELAILQVETGRREEAIAELREIRVQEEGLIEEVTALERRLSRMEMRAPVSGVVYDLSILGPQSVVRPAEPVLFLVPQDRPLVISSRIELIDIDQVFVGQEASLRFSAFDARRTPEVFGRVTRVSADVFRDEVTGGSFYEAELTLAPGEIERLGDAQILPGMPVEAFIRTQDRSPLAYFVEPLAAYFNRAFREG
ncbi:MAG: HlyD family type I secretion periplasmic adaptor subunit [Pseudomonadota bacterium]